MLKRTNCIRRVPGSGSAGPMTLSCQLHNAGKLQLVRGPSRLTFSVSVRALFLGNYIFPSRGRSCSKPGVVGD